MILIISSLGDPHATSVIKKLTEKGASYFLFDTSQFPKAIQLTFESDAETEAISLLETGAAADVDFSSVNVAWWRRPLPIVLHDDITDTSAIQFTFSECFAALSGIWRSLDALWINDPVLDEAASKKIYQLSVARQTGFLIPATCITNNLQKAKAFIDGCRDRKVIYKTFLASQEAWRETRVLKEEQMVQLQYLKFAPVIFQEFIPAIADLRITIMGEKIFCIAVDSSKSGYEYDYRVGLEQAVAEPHLLPPNLEALLMSFMKRLGLVYGAIDMRLTPGGQYYFLEINTAGEWQFLEEKTTLGITDYFVDFLIDKDV